MALGRIPLRKDEDWIGRPRVPVLAHQVDLRVLEADDFFGLQLDPAREESRAMGAVLVEVIGDADASSGRLVPRDLVHTVGEADDMDLLALDPASADHAAMNAVVDRALVLEIHLVLPAIGISMALSDWPGLR